VSEQRWARLADDLKAGGVKVKIDEKSYSESVHGRVAHGVERSITIRVPHGVIEIADMRWTKNPDVWIGWSVTLVGRDDITVYEWRRMKDRKDVLAAVAAALEPIEVAR
jgi:hypothetical protein